jgi:hypothetical protein
VSGLQNIRQSNELHQTTDRKTVVSIEKQYMHSGLQPRSLLHLQNKRRKVMKKTPWFDGKTKPVREGVYEIKGMWFGIAYAYWTGRKWCWAKSTIKEANCDKDFRGAMQNKVWRGLLRGDV